MDVGAMSRTGSPIQVATQASDSASQASGSTVGDLMDSAGYDLMERDWPVGRRPLDIEIVDLRPVASPPSIATKLCPKQHPNNPDADRCTTCRREIAAATPVLSMEPRPVARLLLEDGTAIDIAHRLIIGRSPRDELPADSPDVGSAANHDPAGPDPVAGPHAIEDLNGAPDDAGTDTLSVTGPQVSRRHLMLDVQGWQLLIRDAGSTNGTFLSRPGERGRQRVPAGRAAPVHIGDSIHFGSRRALVVHVR